jgi:predicted MFS family arabinose efflux permease
MARRRGPLAQPALRRLWVSRLLSNAGSYVQLTAVAWLVLREHGGPAHLGLVIAIATLPAALLVLEGGALADRFPVRPFVGITTVLLAVNAVALTVVESVEGLTLWEISAGAAISGTLGALSAPSTMRLTHLAVDEDDLPAANSLFSIEFNLARLAGPAVGGLLIAAGAPGLCFAANAASYLVFALVVAWIPLRKQVGRARGLSLRAGLRAVRAVSPLVTVTAVLAPIGLLGMNLSVFARSSLMTCWTLERWASGSSRVPPAPGHCWPEWSWRD